MLPEKTHVTQHRHHTQGGGRGRDAREKLSRRVFMFFFNSNNIYTIYKQRFKCFLLMNRDGWIRENELLYSELHNL